MKQDETEEKKQTKRAKLFLVRTGLENNFGCVAAIDKHARTSN